MRFAIGPILIFFFTCVAVSHGQDSQAEQARPEKYSQFNRPQSVNRDVSFQLPQEVLPGKSSTRIELLVQETISLLDGEELRHRSYNGGLVGPTIRVNPGQSLHVRLKNILRASSSSHRGNDSPHGFNVTNLHTHGLHVSPNWPADFVFKEVKPGDSADYTFEIPKKHHPGTYWYHAHKHGSTALQLASGMAGALIVNGGLDNAPVVKDAAEKILVIQQFNVTRPEGEPGYIDPDSIYGDGPSEFVESINGVVTPTIVMRPGEIQRWRIIHAGTTEVTELDIEGINFHEIAVDGLATGRITRKNRLTLYPGYRSDVLVQAPDISTERLMTSRVSDPEKSLRESIGERRSLLRIVVAGDPQPMDLPTDAQLKPFAAFTQKDVPDQFAKTRKIEFDITGRTKFLVNGKPFDPTRIDQTIELNTSEEWEISSEKGVHPFHIHVNPFASRLKGSNEPWVWRDTIVVRPGKPMILRTTYKTFTGKTVLHCHNLKHEDLGMMQAIEIVDSGSTVSSKSPKPSFPEAPKWSAENVDGKMVSSQAFKNRPVLIVFHRGMNCIHCAQQLGILQKHCRRFDSAGIKVIAISQFLPDEKAAIEMISSLGFPVLVDQELECFKRFDCIGDEGVPNHGLFLLNSNNQIIFSEQTQVAVTDSKQLVDRIIKSLD